jgi:hypothetical protein
MVIFQQGVQGEDVRAISLPVNDACGSDAGSYPQLGLDACADVLTRCPGREDILELPWRCSSLGRGMLQLGLGFQR